MEFQMNIYKDGKKTILVFDNCSPNVEKLLSTIISSIQNTTINNISDLQAAEKKVQSRPNVEELQKNQVHTAPTAMNNQVYQQMANIPNDSIVPLPGYNKFKQTFIHKNSQKNLSPIDLKVLNTEINNYYNNVLKTTDFSAFDTNTLKLFLSDGNALFFPNFLTKFMQNNGFASFKDLLEAGDIVMLEAIKFCLQL